MARYKDSDRSQIFFTEIDFSRQLVEGTIEHTIDYLIENKIDLSGFDQHFQNEKTGAPAYHPKVMLKVILYAYYNGILSSRKIEKACQTNIIFMTLAVGKTPHFTYIADFIHRFEGEIKKVFLEVLLICWEMELIGGEFLALDGCKLPSSAAKEWSGTFSDLEKKEEKIRKTVDFLTDKHKKLDRSDPEKKTTKSQINNITAKADKIKDYLEKNEPYRVSVRETRRTPQAGRCRCPEDGKSLRSDTAFGPKRKGLCSLRFPSTGKTIRKK